MAKAGWLRRFFRLGQTVGQPESCVQTVTEAVVDLEPGDVFEIGDFSRDERGKRIVVRKVLGYHSPSGRKDDPFCMLFYR